ncbi:MAG: alpha/beta hydrolase [Calditrichaeota bacterium]|nr:alpha/beta hydrolase [Calditrichota bacterium]
MLKKPASLTRRIKEIFLLSIIGIGLLWMIPPSGAQTIHSGLPLDVDTTAHYLFYLHGRIIEEQGIRPRSERFGIYEYEQILQTFAKAGFVVISEARPKGTRVGAYARKIVQQIDSLINAGVPPAHITVVGASKGAAIAVWVSHLLNQPEARFVLIAICNPRTLAAWKQQGVRLRGRVLSIHEASDPIGNSCRELFSASRGNGLTAYQEIELHTGLAHGVLYRPLPEWVNPTIEWAKHGRLSSKP